MTPESTAAREADPSVLRGSGQSVAWSSAGSPELSVIIPTFNRQDILAKVLSTLEAQAGVAAGTMEVLVADDGSSDGTAAALQEFASRTALPFAYLLLAENKGPARARNCLALRTRGRLVLMLGDDIVPAPDLVQRHLAWHGQHPSDASALLGRVTWPEDLHPSPFMRWLEHGGRHFYFNFADARVDGPLSSIFFYTCNVSLKRCLFVSTGGFDESFPLASHEDLELGFRLTRLGMQLYWDPDAVGYHWHWLEFPGTFKRIYLMGYSARIYWQKVPDDAGFMKRMLRHVLRKAASSRLVQHGLLRALASPGNNAPASWSWPILLNAAFWRGLDDAHRGRNPREALARLGVQRGVFT